MRSKARNSWNFGDRRSQGAAGSGARIARLRRAARSNRALAEAVGAINGAREMRHA
jgi:hypothetical protein